MAKAAAKKKSGATANDTKNQKASKEKPGAIKKDKKDKEVVKKAISKEKKSKKNSSEEPDEESKLLEVGLLLDCTSSMSSWIERAKKTLQEII